MVNVPRSVDEQKATVEEELQLRDYFGAFALQGLIARGWLNNNSEDQIAKAAYGCADAMMKVREKGKA